MPIKAVIFDIYGTLLEVLPPPPLRDARWQQLWIQFGLNTPPLSLEAFKERCQAMVAASHRQSLDQGIDYPEVDWRKIAQHAVPDLSSFSESDLDDFLYEHAQLVKTVQLMRGAEKVLHFLKERRIILGLCSNCQGYSLRELSQALHCLSLSLDLFEPSCCFYSFQAGFSKPNPKAFHWLCRQLEQRSISAHQTLMVGDRLDNDILPAQRIGWQAWHLSSAPSHSEMEQSGNYDQFLNYLNITQ